jgi:hypothetical protein
MSEWLARIVGNLEPMEKFDSAYSDFGKIILGLNASRYFQIGVDESVDERKAARRRLVSY